jgi:hypothetical protein
MTEPIQVKYLSGARLQGRLLASSTNITIGLKGFPGMLNIIKFLEAFVNYDRKTFYKIGPSGGALETPARIATFSDVSIHLSRHSQVRPGLDNL